MMEKEFNELRNYFIEAKHKRDNQSHSAYVLATCCKKAIERIETIKLKLNDSEDIEICSRAIKGLEEAPAQLEQYSKSSKGTDMIGDFHLFNDISRTLYDNLESFLQYFDELE